ncbi:MAG: nucleotidyl transferase AbiEii/AbiGii toxin family protein [Chloroflexota bacterium]|nr:nucleotidyl transferase AbiEii/AbiGii toxin family protein [Chloroflexota bacterium]
MTANMAQSVRDRLLRRARERGEDFNFLLNRFAVERFLYRLSLSPHRDRFVLKGASLFAIWAVQSYRATRDIDLEGFGPNDPEAVGAMMREVCAVAVADDGLTLLPDDATAASIRDAEQYGGVRIRIPARLGNAHTDVQIDVGFGDAITPPAAEVDYPTLLPFPAPRLRAYPRETVVAEKWEAIVSLGVGNSRMKDFFDAWILARDFAYDGATLAAAIGATFARRSTTLPTDPPTALTAAFAEDPAKQRQWQAFLRRGGAAGAPATLAEMVAALGPFLMPPTHALSAGLPFTQQWLPGGPWYA